MTSVLQVPCSTNWAPRTLYGNIRRIIGPLCGVFVYKPLMYRRLAGCIPSSHCQLHWRRDKCKKTHLFSQSWRSAADVHQTECEHESLPATLSLRRAYIKFDGLFACSINRNNVDVVRVVKCWYYRLSSTWDWEEESHWTHTQVWCGFPQSQSEETPHQIHEYWEELGKQKSGNWWSTEAVRGEVHHLMWHHDLYHSHNPSYACPLTTLQS